MTTKIKPKIRLFHKFLASLWIASMMLLGFGMNPAFVSSLRAIDGDLGLLHKPKSEIQKWSNKKYLDSLFAPVQTNAQRAVVVVGNPIAAAAAIALSLEQKLLRAVLMAIVRFIVNKLTDFIGKLIDSLTKAQDQFGIMKSIQGYARKALAVGTAKLYDCATASIDDMVNSIGPGKTTSNNTSGCGSKAPTTTGSDTNNVKDLVAQGQQVLDSCAAERSATSVASEQCLGGNIQNIKSNMSKGVELAVKESCVAVVGVDEDDFDLIDRMNPKFSDCSQKAVEDKLRHKAASQERQNQIETKATQTIASAEKTAGTGSLAVLDESTVKNMKITPVAVEDAFATKCFGENVDCSYSIDKSGNKLGVFVLPDPEFNKQSVALSSLGIQAKPQAGGQADEGSLLDIQQLFTQILDQVKDAIQNLIFSMVNSLLSKLDSLTGGNGFFSGLISDITGSVKQYIGAKVQILKTDLDNRYKDLKATLFKKNTNQNTNLNTRGTIQDVIPNTSSNIG